MPFVFLVLGAIAMFWIAGEIQELGQTLITLVAYFFSFALGVFAFLSAAATMSGDEE